MALSLLLASTACTSVPVILDSKTGDETSVEQIASACLEQDVVFFGEVHNSDENHEQQRALLDALCQKHKDVVVSMEMFERDVQDKLDAYLAGKLAEPEFKKQARAWPNWNHYRPVVQIAAMRKLPVIAANAPRPLAAKVRKKGLDAVRGNPHVARELEAPADAY